MATTEKLCPRCGRKEFTLAERRCAHCGGRFQPRRVDHRYCRPQCGNSAWVRENRRKEKAS